MDLVPDAKIVSSQVSRTGGDAIDLMTTDALLENIQIAIAGDKGISIGEKSNPVVRNVRIADSNIGIAIKDRSNPTVSGLSVKNSRAGIEAYSKNWRYGGGGLGTITDFDICENAAPVFILPDSNVQFITKGQKISCTDSSCHIGCFA